jgi:ABC-type transporter Mla subunit MlaD
MAEYRRSEIVTGLFILLAIAAFVFLAWGLGKVDLAIFRGDSIHCYAFFRDVLTLEEGAKVVVGGKPVGTVRRIHLSEETIGDRSLLQLEQLLGEYAERPVEKGMTWQAIRVEFDLDNTDLLLDKETATVALAQEGLLGRHHLDLQPGYWVGDSSGRRFSELASGEPLKIGVRATGGLQSLMKDAGPALQAARSVLAKIETGLLNETNLQNLEAMLGEGSEAIRAARKALTNIEMMADPANADGLHAMVLAPAKKLLEDADTQLNALGERLLDKTLTDVEAVLADARKALGNADEAMITARSILDENKPVIDRTLENLAQATDGLKARIDRIEAQLGTTLEGARLAMDQANGMLRENRAGLADIVRKAQQTMWDLQMAVRKIRANPAYVLFGDDEKLMEAREVDEAGVRLSGRAKAYGQRDEDDAGKK